MKVLVACLSGLVLLNGVAMAATTSREAKVEELVRVTGMADMLEQGQVTARAQASQLSKQIVAEIFKDGKAPSSGQQAKIEVAMQRFLEACAASMDVKEAAALWGQLYAANLSDAELDQILSYYKSEIGKKDVAATQAAMPLWQAQLSEKGTATMQAGIAELTREIREIVKAGP
jgi:hypothetical protein